MNLASSQASFAEAILDRAQPFPTVATTRLGLPDNKRISVYRNNVFVGLTQALASRFPVTEKLVGDEFFVGMASTFAHGRKPTSPLMLEYGDEFPEFIANFEPAASLSYLADVARLEVAWTKAYHTKDTPALPLAAIIDQTDNLPNVRLDAHPATAFLQSRHPVGSIWAAHQGETIETIRAWTPEAVIVVRPEMEVRVHVIPANDAVFAAEVLNGSRLGEASETALRHNPNFEFGAALVGLIQLGAFASFKIDERV